MGTNDFYILNKLRDGNVTIKKLDAYFVKINKLVDKEEESSEEKQ